MPTNPTESALTIQGVLFDMDGTLIDSEPLWHRHEEELMASFDYTWLEEDQRYCLGGPLSKVGRYMYEKVGYRKTPEYFTDELIRRVENDLRNGVLFMPGALALAESIHEAGVALALVSASPRNLMDAALEGVGMSSRYGRELFALSISANDVVKTKPDPEGYISAAKQLGVDIQQCLALEDSLTGIQSATASGARTIAIPHYITIEETSQLRVIPSLENLTIYDLQSLFDSMAT
jgi:HAD superfamily hydrolase (TIGR01509 family)